MTQNPDVGILKKYVSKDTSTFPGTYKVSPLLPPLCHESLRTHSGPRGAKIRPPSSGNLCGTGPQSDRIASAQIGSTCQENQTFCTGSNFFIQDCPSDCPYARGKVHSKVTVTKQTAQICTELCPGGDSKDRRARATPRARSLYTSPFLRTPVLRAIRSVTERRHRSASGNWACVSSAAEL